jgi:hypothetical protein
MTKISLTDFPLKVELFDGSTLELRNSPIIGRKAIQDNYILNTSVGHLEGFNRNANIEQGTILYQASSDINLDATPPILGVSPTSIFDQDPLITLESFEERPYSMYSLQGLNPATGIPSINLSGAIFNSFPSASVLQVQGSVNPLGNFPDSGKVQLNNDVITYTGKTTNTLTGITRSNPSATHTAGDYMRTISV